MALSVCWVHHLGSGSTLKSFVTSELLTVEEALTTLEFGLIPPLPVIQFLSLV